jgi:hypothetical protein
LYGYAADTAVAAAISGANTTQTASGGTFLSGPLDITGFVDVYYGKPEFYPLSITAGVAVPEPASLGMLAVSAIGLLARRRRV